MIIPCVLVNGFENCENRESKQTIQEKSTQSFMCNKYPINRVILELNYWSGRIYTFLKSSIL